MMRDLKKYVYIYEKREKTDDKGGTRNQLVNTQRKLITAGAPLS